MALYCALGSNDRSAVKQPGACGDLLFSPVGVTALSLSVGELLATQIPAPDLVHLPSISPLLSGEL